MTHFAQWQITDICVVNKYSYASTFVQRLDSLPSNSIIFVFIYLSRRKPRLGGYTALSSLCLYQCPRQRFLTAQATGYRSAQERA